MCWGRGKGPAAFLGHVGCVAWSEAIRKGPTLLALIALVVYIYFLPTLIIITVTQDPTAFPCTAVTHVVHNHVHKVCMQITLRNTASHIHTYYTTHTPKAKPAARVRVHYSIYCPTLIYFWGSTYACVSSHRWNGSVRARKTPNG